MPARSPMKTSRMRTCPLDHQWEHLEIPWSSERDSYLFSLGYRWFMAPAEGSIKQTHDEVFWQANKLREGGNAKENVLFRKRAARRDRGSGDAARAVARSRRRKRGRWYSCDVSKQICKRS
eukprot:3858341-Pyramimonas_sp.AAC.1